jgi:hypothetical protein
MSEGEKKTTQRWVLPLIGFVLALSFGISFGPELLDDWRVKRIRENGVQAPAVIVDLVDTGNRSNSNPEVELILEVRPEHGKPFPATATKVLTPVALQKHGPGTEVIVMYDPEEPERAVLLGVKADATR